MSYDKTEPVDNVITWVYEEGNFTPIAKLVNGERFSIVSDYLGTPIQAFDASGEKVWERELTIYGGVRKETGVANFIAMRYQGQYFDQETELCYNRFRYYNPETGAYLSQDPIGLHSGQPNFYAYVKDSNNRIDPFGLMDPFDIQFSQNSISDVFNEGPWKGKSLEEAIEATRKAGRLPEGLTLNVMELNGGENIVTLNNRTLYVAQEAGINVHPTFVDNINKLNKLLDGGVPLDIGEQPVIKCKK